MSSGTSGDSSLCVGIPWKEKFSIEEAGIVILAMIFGIAVVVARDIQRWRDQTEFLEDIMQVLGDKEQN